MFGLTAGEAIAAGTAIYGATQSRGSSPSVSNQPSMSPEQQGALRTLLTRLQGGDPNGPAYGGQLTAGLSGLQNTSLSALEQMAMNNANNATATPGSNIPGGQDMWNTIRGAMTASPADTERLFSDTVEAPAIKDWNENVMPQITQQFRGSAGYGSDKVNFTEKAMGNLSGNLTSARSKMVYDATQAQQNRALQAAGMIPGMAAAGSALQGDQVSRLMQMLTAGSVPQQNAQAALSARYGEFQRQQAQGNTNISQILSALGLGTQNQVVNPGQQGFLTSMAPGIGQAGTQWLLNQKPGGGGTPSPNIGGPD